MHHSLQKSKRNFQESHARLTIQLDFPITLATHLKAPVFKRGMKDAPLAGCTQQLNTQ